MAILSNHPSAIATRKYREKNRAERKCINCPSKALLGHTRCRKHLDQLIDHNKRLAQKRKEEGKCTRCGHPEVEEGFTKCNGCLCDYYGGGS